MVVHIRNKKHFTGQRIIKQSCRITDVFCISTNNKTFILKQNDHISITGNCVYGAGPQKLMDVLNVSLDFATKLHTTYWKRNKAVKDVSANVITKLVNGNMWLYNPVSTFWYPLRYEKDIFSGLNQSTGVYCFDRNIAEVRKRGVKMSFQYHDEWMACFDRREITEEQVKQIIKESIDTVNENLKLNVPLGSSADFGLNYAQIH